MIQVIEIIISLTLNLNTLPAGKSMKVIREATTNSTVTVTALFPLDAKVLIRKGNKGSNHKYLKSVSLTGLFPLDQKSAH